MSSEFSVREMSLKEIDIRIEYFHRASTDYLKYLGVKREKLPSPSKMRSDYKTELTIPLEDRQFFALIWLDDNGRSIGFSTLDKISFGNEARMHLHILQEQNRHHGAGSTCVRLSTGFYFDHFQLKRIICEPNAFNTAPNRTLQKAGFRFVKTYETVPGPINFSQAVTQWIIELSETHQ